MVSIGTHFVNCKVHEGVQARILEQQFGIELEQIQQGAGVVGDYSVKVNSEKFQSLFPLIDVIELKNDKTSLIYKSFYCEFEQTRDGWRNSHKSGHLKAVEDGCLLVVQSGPNFFCFTAETFMPLFNQSAFVNETKRNSNGNSNGAFTRAKIIQIKDCANVFKFSI